VTRQNLAAGTVSMRPLSASAEGSALFELMTAEVVASFGRVLAERAAAAAAAAWRDRVRCRQAKRERAACAAEMARWSCEYAHFSAMLEYQRLCAAGRLARAREFWRLSVLQSFFCAWGPDFKLRLAERIGDADRGMRRAVQRCRLHSSFSLWSVWGSNGRLRGKERCPAAFAAVLFHRCRQTVQSRSLLSWRSDACWRSGLRPTLAKLGAAAARRCLQHAFTGLVQSVHCCPVANSLARKILQRCWLAWYADWIGPAREALTVTRQRHFLRCWRSCTAHWRGVAERCKSFRHAWTSIRGLLSAKRLLQCWLGRVVCERARETDLENLLEYYNKDVELAAKRLAWATRRWAMVASQEATESGDKARGHARMTLRRHAMQGWRIRAACKKREAARRSGFATCLRNVLSRSRQGFLTSRTLGDWRAVCVESRPYLAQIETLVGALHRRRLLYGKQRALHQWQSALILQAAQELAQVRVKRLVCEAFGQWRLLLEDAPILYPHQWQTVKHRFAGTLARLMRVQRLYVCVCVRERARARATLVCVCVCACACVRLMRSATQDCVPCAPIPPEMARCMPPGCRA